MDTRARLGQLKNELLSNAPYTSSYLLSEVLLACAYYKIKMTEENNVDTKRWLNFLARMRGKPELGYHFGDHGDTVTMNCTSYDSDLNNVIGALEYFFAVKADSTGAMSPEGARYWISIPVAKMQNKAGQISEIIKKLQDGFKALPTPRFDAFSSKRKSLLDKYSVSAEKTDIFEEVLLRTFGVDKDLTSHTIEARHDSGKRMLNHRDEPDMLCVALGIDADLAQVFSNNFKAQFRDGIFNDLGAGKSPDGKACVLWGFILDDINLRKLFEMLETTIVRDYVNGPLKNRLTSYQIASGYAPVSQPVQTSTAALLSSIPTSASTTTNAVQPNNKPMTLGCRKYLEANTARAEIMRDIYQQDPDIFENCEYAQLKPYLCQLTKEPAFLPVIINGKNYDWNAVRNHVVGNKFVDPVTKVEIGVDQITFNEDLINGLGALIEQQLAQKEAQQSSTQTSSNNNTALFQSATTSRQQLEYVSVRISAKGDIDDFAKIDPRIIASGEWEESYPPSTSIEIPIKFQAEITEKLLRHPRILSVGDQQNAMRY